MSDLIRKSDVLDLLYGIFDKYKMSTDKNTSIGKSFGTDVFEEIRNMPTAYSVDKVVEELEKESFTTTDTVCGGIFKAIRLSSAIEIVKQCGKKIKGVEYMDEDELRYCHHDDTDEYHDCLEYIDMECEECPYYYADLD